MNLRPKFLTRKAAADPASQHAQVDLAEDVPTLAEPEVAGRSGLRALLDGKRMVRVAALLGIAWGAGEMMQFLGPKEAAPKSAAVTQDPNAGVATAEVTLVPVEPDANAQPTENAAVAADEPSDTLAASVADDADKELPTESTADVQQVLAAVAPSLTAVEPIESVLAVKSEASVQLASAGSDLDEAEEKPELKVEEPSALAGSAPVAENCDPVLRLSALPGALVGVSLVAPCAQNARVVLKHEGLSITAVTTATGALLTSLPALATSAEVTAMLPDLAIVAETVEVPEASIYRRFGLQWQGDDVFQVNAYENGAGFGDKGHISEANPGAATAVGGFLQVFGDPNSAMPLMAQVYTYPIGAASVSLSVEAPVTAGTCGREMIGETLFSGAGRVILTDLTLVMPDCDAIGDFLVLNNLIPDVTLASN